VLVEVARVKDVGLAEVGSSGKVGLSEKVVLVAVKEGASTSLQVQILFMAVTAQSSWFWVCRCLTGRPGLDSLYA
jgi:hypothetical protein